MLTTLLLAATTAHATEVGTTRKMGVGIALPWPAEITGKYWLDDQSGVAAFIGGYYVYPELRAQYERDLFDIANFDWAILTASWDVGVEFDVFPPAQYHRAGVGFGLYGGTFARLQFHHAPFEVFAGPDLGLRVQTFSSIQPVRALVHASVGVRYYLLK